MSNFRERVDRHLTEEAKISEQAKSEEKRKILVEADAANLRLELSDKIIEKIDRIGISQMFQEINTDIWKGYGEYSEVGYSQDEVITQRNFKLAAVRKDLLEKWQEVKKWKFGRHDEWIDRGKNWETGERGGYYVSSFGSYQETVALELVGYDVKNAWESCLGVEVWTGGASIDTGRVILFDSDYRLTLPDFRFRVEHIREYRGTKLQLNFKQNEFDMGNVSTLIDSVFLASSIERAKHFVPKMREQDEKMANIVSRVGERKSV